MSKPTRPILKTFIGLAATLLLLTFLVVAHYHNTTKTLTTAFVTPIGAHMPSLFSGLAPNPLYSLKHIKLVQQGRPQPCSRATTQKTRNSIVRLFTSTTVYAQTCQQSCTGSNWVENPQSCYSSGCVGGLGGDSIYDPMSGGPCDGFGMSACYGCTAYCPEPVCKMC
jgi:hypothetical protein